MMILMSDVNVTWPGPGPAPAQMWPALASPEQRNVDEVKIFLFLIAWPGLVWCLPCLPLLAPSAALTCAWWLLSTLDTGVRTREWGPETDLSPLAWWLTLGTEECGQETALAEIQRWSGQQNNYKQKQLLPFLFFIFTAAAVNNWRQVRPRTEESTLTWTQAWHSES